jgi:hypothetical protein
MLTPIEQTQKWVETVVVGLNLCPFARRVVEKERIRYVLAEDESKTLEVFQQTLRLLDADETIETALIVLSHGYTDFLDYLDLLEEAENWIEEADYEGVYQVASFHPEYQFADSDMDDPANYTNRSPYPILHILREASVSLALEWYPGNPDQIPERNVALTREMGLAQMQALKAACERE